MMKSRVKKYLKLAGVVLFVLIGLGFQFENKLQASYTSGRSPKITDRYGALIFLKPNDKQYFSLYRPSTPPLFTSWLLKKEDRYFYYHPGVNPVSLIEAVLDKFGLINRRGSSTITQQVVKLLLKNETDRSFQNKITELIYSLVHDLFRSKNKILVEYLNSSYFGNRVQGLETASRAYFKVSPDKLSNEQVLQLLVTLSNPSYNNPTSGTNIVLAQNLANTLAVSANIGNFISPNQAVLNLEDFNKLNDGFELETYFKNSGNNDLELTIDLKLTREIRKIVNNTMPSLYLRDAHNAAVVVINAHTNEILSIVGTPDPESKQFGQQINMALEPRQIASTIKPFLYLKAFENELRPYTLIEDAEYKFRTGDGRTLYLKNFDYRYRGLVSAAYALSNSINVPAVKTLEFIGQEKFAEFLADLNYSDQQKIGEHQLGVALGTLPFSLLELTHDYSIFPRQGNYYSIRLFRDQTLNDGFFPKIDREIVDKKFIQLINRILSDRHLATDQFGYTSNLNLSLNNYALKTGTSDDYRDTWVIGYTPDFVVGAWAGNADNSSTKKLSGQSGAGEIWSRVMELMVSTQYHKQTPFDFSEIIEIPEGQEANFGLPGDNFEQYRFLLNDKTRNP
ncbi:MAG TPA: transglycosylase domain-containing protein [Candidatus Paceibacterota bacterium]